MNRGFYWILKALLSHYWRHPWQSLFLVLGLVAGVSLWSAVQIINQQAEASYRQAQNLLGAQASYWIRSRQDQGIDEAFYIQLRREGFREVYPLVELEVSTPQAQSISIIATDLVALPEDLFEETEDGEDFSERWLKFIQPPYRSWVPAQLADELGLKEGERLLLRDGRSLPPALIQSREQQGRRVFIDIAAAFSLSGTRSFSYLAVAAIKPAQLARLRAWLPDQLELVENQQQFDLQQLTESLHTHLSAMSLLSFAVGLFIVFNAVRFSLWYRRATLFKLRLMGCDQRQLLLAILLETLLWSLVGSLLGFLCGIVLAQLLLPGLGASLHSLYAASIDTVLQLDAITLLQAWCISLIGLLWALAWPLYRLLRLPALSAADTTDFMHSEALARKRLALASILLALLAWFYFGRIQTTTEGFILLGLILFSAAWMLPSLLAGALRLLGQMLPQRFLLTRWMVSDGWSQLPALRSAMMALLLAFTANIGVGILVDSFRGAFVDWLSVRQSADIYLSNTQLDYERLVSDGVTDEWLVHSSERIGVSTRWGGRPALIRGADTLAPDSLAFPLSKWQGDTAAEALQSWREKPATVLINEQLHFLAGVQIGDQIELNSDYGAQKYDVVGIFYDYGNPYFQFYLPRQALAKHWKHYYSRGIALWLNKDNEQAMQQAEASLKALGAQPGDWIMQTQLRRLSVGIFDRTFAITAAMNLLTMIIAAIALFASLLAILQERLPQFAQWRALGLRQYEQLLLVATPLLLFSAIVWIASIPLGSLLGWVLIDKLNVISFGWSMPLLWQAGPAVQLAGVMLLIIFLALLSVSIQWRRQLPRALARLGEAI